MPSKPSGFTVFELAVTLILMSIMAAVALHKFLAVTSSANITLLQSMAGTIRTNSLPVYSKALMSGVQNAEAAAIDLDGDGSGDLEINFGYPSVSLDRGLSKIMGESFANDWAWATTADQTKILLAPAPLVGRSGSSKNDRMVTTSECYLLYSPATRSGTSPIFGFVTTGC